MRRLPLPALLALLSLPACDTDKGDSATDSGATGTSAGHILDTSKFSGLVSSSLITCSLSDGTTGDCYELTFDSSPVAEGPYCPETIDDVGGLGVYDGRTGAGFQVMMAALWESMEADGYDIVDNNGNVRIDDFQSQVDRSYPYCLEAAADGSLQLVFTIPAIPAASGGTDAIGEVELMGVSLDGVPINGDPPSVVAHQGNIPALDPCGGHQDPAGYYHWHLISNSANALLADLGITEVSCTNMAQDTTALAGYARDGYPIYGEAERDGSDPTGLDSCNGHTGATADYPDGVYHYHAVQGAAPDVPPCTVGRTATTSFSYR